MLSSYYCRKDDTFSCRKDDTSTSPIIDFVLLGKYSISFIPFSVRFVLKLLNYFSPATVLVHAVLITADFDASAFL